VFVEYAGILAAVTLMAVTLTGAYGRNVSAVFDSSGEEEATHFGPRSQVSACSTWAVARSSTLSRRSVADARVLAKFGGNLRCVAVSMSTSMSIGRRPAKNRPMISGDTAKPARVSSVAATLATIASLSTSTPLQSKMNTGGPRNSRCPGSRFPSCLR